MIEVDVRLQVGAFSLDVAFANGAGVTALFGQSGSGKSLTLSIIAGLIKPDAGYIRLDGDTLVDVATGVFVPVSRRRIGLVADGPGGDSRSRKDHLPDSHSRSR